MEICMAKMGLSQVNLCRKYMGGLKKLISLLGAFSTTWGSEQNDIAIGAFSPLS